MIAAADPTAIAGLLTALAAIGGTVAIFRRMGPERRAIEVNVQGEIIESLRAENQRLTELNAQLEGRVSELTDRLKAAEDRQVQLASRLYYIEQGRSADQ